jgi:hypothetical protein
MHGANEGREEQNKSKADALKKRTQAVLILITIGYKSILLSLDV